MSFPSGFEICPLITTPEHAPGRLSQDVTALTRRSRSQPR